MRVACFKSKVVPDLDQVSISALPTGKCDHAVRGAVYGSAAWSRPVVTFMRTTPPGAEAGGRAVGAAHREAKGQFLGSDAIERQLVEPVQNFARAQACEICLRLARRRKADRRQRTALT